MYKMPCTLNVLTEGITYVWVPLYNKGDFAAHPEVAVGCLRSRFKD